MTSQTPERWSEERRHRCEVRYVAMLPDNRARHRYLARVAEHRGEAVAERLRQEAWALLQEEPCP